LKSVNVLQYVSHAVHDGVFISDGGYLSAGLNASCLYSSRCHHTVLKAEGLRTPAVPTGRPVITEPCRAYNNVQGLKAVIDR